MYEVILWVFAIYGVLCLFFSLWNVARSKRKWTLIFLADDPRRVEGELRSLLFDFLTKNFYPEKLIVLWQNYDYDLARKISEEFPGVEVVEMVGEASLADIIGDERDNNIFYFGGTLDT